MEEWLPQLQGFLFLVLLIYIFRHTEIQPVWSIECYSSSYNLGLITWYWITNWRDVLFSGEHYFPCSLHPLVARSSSSSRIEAPWDAPAPCYCVYCCQPWSGHVTAAMLMKLCECRFSDIPRRHGLIKKKKIPCHWLLYSLPPLLQWSLSLRCRICVSVGLGITHLLFSAYNSLQSSVTVSICHKGKFLAKGENCAHMWVLHFYARTYMWV